MSNSDSEANSEPRWLRRRRAQHEQHGDFNASFVTSTSKPSFLHRLPFLKKGSEGLLIDPATKARNRAEIVQYRFLPYVIVGIGVLFGLWTLRSARLPVMFPNDESVHIAMVTEALHQWRSGHFPLDSWFPYLSLGSPFFLHYQSTPAILTGALGLLIGAPHAFGWTLYLLLALWPLSVYWGARLMGWDRWVAACAAAMSPLLVNFAGYGFGHQAYLWRGNGIWSQLWGMWMLPLAWGFAYRAVSQRRNVFAAVASLSAIIAFHFLTAYLAGLTLLLWVILRPTQIYKRLKIAVLVGVGAVFATLWVTAPLAATNKFSAVNQFNAGTYFADSYGARQVLSWLIHGQLYDSGHFPIITIFVFIGLFDCIRRFRRDEKARALVAVWVMSMVLYFGRPTVGFLIDILPANDQLLLHRYIMGIQLAGLFIAGVGVVFTAKILFAGFQLLASPALFQRACKPLAAVVFTVIAGVGFVAVLTPAWNDVGNYDASNTVAISDQQVSDATQGAEVDTLVAKAESLGGGRIFVGLPTTPAPWGYAFNVGQVPVYIYLTNKNVDAVGFSLRTSSLMTDPEAYFDDANLGDYEMFGIHFLLAPAGFSLPVAATFVEQSGPYVLYSVGTGGLVQVVDTTSPIAENSSNIGTQTASFLQSALPGERRYPTVAYAGATAATPTASTTAVPSSPAGSVISESDDLEGGQVSATITASRTSVVLLASSFDPGWTVTVDGQPAKTEMVAPALTGVEVNLGQHVIAFRYQAFRYYPELFFIGLITLLIFGLGPRLRRRIQKQKHDDPVIES